MHPFIRNTLGLVLGGVLVYAFVAGFRVGLPAPAPRNTVHAVMLHAEGVDAYARGSGVMIAPRIMLTAAHVVADWPEGTTPRVGGDPARVVRMDVARDLAILLVSLGCPCASFTVDLPRDAPAVAIGYPLGGVLANVAVLTEGRVQALIELEHGWRVLATTPIAFGNSGGGLFVGGKLAGIIVEMPGQIVPMGWAAISVPVGHLALAVPVTTIREFLDGPNPALDAVKSAPLPAPTGEALLRDVKRQLEKITRILDALEAASRDGWTD